METRHIESRKRTIQANSEKKVCIKEILINKSDTQGDQFITNTRIKHGDRSWDLTLLKIHLSLTHWGRQ